MSLTHAPSRGNISTCRLLQSDLKVLGLAPGIIRHRFINNFTIFNTRNSVNDSLLSHRSALTSQRTAFGSASDFSRTGNTNISSATNFGLSHTRNKLPALHPNNIVCLLQDNTIVSCQFWVGWTSLYTTEQKSSAVHFLRPSPREFYGRVHTKKNHSWTYFYRSRKRKCWIPALRIC
jgi:hypothetical protein